MGFNPFEEIGKTAAGAGAFLQEQGANVAHAVSDGAGQAAKAANDAGDFLAEQGNNAARAIGDGAGQVSTAIGYGAKAIAKGASDIADNVSNAVKGASDSIDEESAGRILDTIYHQALDGIPNVSRSVDEMVSDYVSKTTTREEAAQALAKVQVMKCGTSGFLTGLGGLVTLPVTIPANVGSVMYVQMRMIACIAKIGGYDVRSDQVQTMVYMCLTGTTVADVVKQAGIKTGTMTFKAAIKKIPGAALVKINQKMGFRFITKMGEKGVINLGKMVPLVGGVVGGGFDIATTSVIAKNAINMFINDEDFDDSAPSMEEIIEVKKIEIEDDSELI